MKSLKIIGVLLFVLVVLFFIVALFLPSKLRMEESMVMKQPSSLIFKQINNFQNWAAWSPWIEKDTAMTMTYTGPELGVGAIYTWTSEVHGDGSITIKESKPYEKVDCELLFAGQSEAAQASFLFEETEEGTRVTWIVEIPHLAYPVERYFGLLMPGMMRPFIRSGLENIDEVTAAMSAPPAITMTTRPGAQVVSILDSCNWSDFDTKMGELFGELMDFMSKTKNVQIVGAPYTMYSKWDEANQFAIFEAGFPVDVEVTSKGRVNYKVLPDAKTITASHFGPYEQIAPVYMALDEYVKEFGLEEECCPMEVYVTDPSIEPDPAKWQTDVYFVIK